MNIIKTRLVEFCLLEPTILYKHYVDFPGWDEPYNPFNPVLYFQPLTCTIFHFEHPCYKQDLNQVLASFANVLESVNLIRSQR